MKYCLVFLFTIGSFGLLAQNDVLYSNYMFNPSYYNPSVVGVDRVSHFMALVRSQWTGYTSSFDGSGGAPSSQLVSAAIPVEGSITGVGLTIINDRIGPQNTFSVDFPVSYSFEIRPGLLSVGIAPGVYFRTLNFNDLRFNNPADPLNIGTSESQTRINLASGVTFQSDENYFIGISGTNLLNPTFDFGSDSLAVPMKTSLILTSGYYWIFSDDIVLQPSMIVRSDFDTFTFDLSMLVEYQEKGWAGLSFRRAEAVILMIGYSFMEGNKLKIGYSMDYVTNERKAKQLTSQEFFVRYDIPDFMFGGRKQVKTPRFTF